MSDPVKIDLSLFQKEAISLLNTAISFATKERDSFIRGIVSSHHDDLNASINFDGSNLIVTSKAIENEVAPT